MSYINELCSDIDESRLRIDCHGIKKSDADKIADIFREKISAKLNSDTFINDGYQDYSGYIMAYVRDYPFLGVHKQTGKITMWNSNLVDVEIIKYKEFLDDANMKEVDVTGFDDLFE